MEKMQEYVELKNKSYKQNLGITLIALVVTIVLNCSFLAMVVKS